jgi:CBS-domain-containing membrane protein
MNVTRTTHPPGGATALIGVEGAAGPEFVVLPILAGALVLLVIATITSRLGQGPRYPAASD